MNVSPEEARESLSEIEQAAERTKKMLAYAGGDVLLIVWGVIWVLGFLGSQVLAPGEGWIWLGLVATGIVITLVVAKRGAPVRSPIDRRIGWFWLLLYVYVSLWLAILFPFLKVQGHAESALFSKHMTAIAATVPMFAYVVMGLWLDHFITWIGLAVTGLTAAGLFLLQPYFYVWMAIAGGGALIGTGLVIRRRWK